VSEEPQEDLAAGDGEAVAEAGRGQPQEDLPRTAAGDGEAVAEAGRGQRKMRQGIVVSDKMDKTVIVQIEHVVRHRSYHKTIRRSRKLAAHDEQGQAHVGDTVRVMETRPLSKTKRWRVVEVIEKAK
jgi:small subunit ribosomal protein S17